jgi:selenide,water dikinase
VTGVVHPKKVLANNGARPGDSLVLTKAIGTGVISTAIKKGVADPAWIAAATASMTTLNKQAAELISSKGYQVHGMTDITGFGVIGHARELALASNVSVRLYSNQFSLLPGAVDCVRAGHIPAGLKANREFAECVVSYEGTIHEDLKTLLFDPQTAGGLFISIAARECEEFVRALEDLGLPARHVGDVEESGKPLIRVV